MTEKTLTMDDVFLTPEDARATHGRWLAAITIAQVNGPINEYLRLMGLNNVETIAEFGPKAQ